jgi:uracil-DNA glycosylase
VNLKLKLQVLNPQLKDKLFSLLGAEWFKKMENYLQTDDFSRLTLELFKERRNYTIYPEQGSDLLFKAFRTTPFSKVKIVILGQDPYHDGSYDGFAFSNTNRVRLSPSLQNILKEVENDVYDGFHLSQDSNLERWAKQGVLLINTAHTVRASEPGSHIHLWDIFTRRVIHSLLNNHKPMVWMLWGSKAKRHLEDRMIDPDQLVLTAPHPSPFSAGSGFFGCKHFSKANTFLIEHNIDPIAW